VDTTLLRSRRVYHEFHEEKEEEKKKKKKKYMWIFKATIETEDLNVILKVSQD